MNSKELADNIKRNLDSDHEIHHVSSIQSVPDMFLDTVRFVVYDDTEERKKFVVTIEELK